MSLDNMKVYRPFPWMIYATALLGLLVTLSLSFPGYLSPDSFSQLEQARTGAFTDWHPPMMAMLWRYLDKLICGPFLMMLFQAIGWWGGLALIVHKVWGNSRFSFLWVCFLGAWPPILAMTGVVWKDVQMAGAFTLAAGLILWRRNWMQYLALGLLFYGTATRHNALFAVLPLAFFSGWSLFRLKSIPKFICSGILALALAFFPELLNETLAKSHTYPTQQIYAYDLVAISVKTGKNLLTPEVQSQPLSIAELKQMYGLDTLAPIYWPRQPAPYLIILDKPQPVQKLKNQWKKMILSHPREYLSHRWGVFSTLLHSSCYSYVHPTEDICQNGKLGITWQPSTLAWRFYNALESYKMGPLFQPIYYLIPLLVFFFSSLSGAFKRKNWAVVTLIFSLSGLMYIVPYFVIVGSSDLRYSLWTMICTGLSLMTLTKHFMRPDDLIQKVNQ